VPERTCTRGTRPRTHPKEPGTHARSITTSARPLLLARQITGQFGLILPEPALRTSRSGAASEEQAFTQRGHQLLVPKGCARARLPFSAFLGNGNSSSFSIACYETCSSTRSPIWTGREGKPGSPYKIGVRGHRAAKRREGGCLPA